MNADDHLRRLRDDDRWTDDAPPLPSPRSTPSARRSLVPVLATAVTALLVAAVAGSVLLTTQTQPAADASTSPTPSSIPSVIPWVDTTPAPSPTSTEASIGVSTGRVPLCALSQLRIGSQQGDTAMGTWRAGVRLTNRSGSACTLNASNVALEAFAGGEYITVGRTTVETDAPGGFRLEPGRTAHFWGNLSACFQYRTFATEVQEPTYLVVSGERVALHETVPNDFRPLCAHPDPKLSVGVSTFDQEGDVLPPTSPYDGLTATLTLPTTVRAGEVVDATVTLSNQTTGTISLTPCPTYDQYYVDSRRLVVTHHVLNCAPVPQLDPGQSATFAMRTVIPLGARGTAKISWALDGDPSVTAIRMIGG